MAKKQNKLGKKLNELESGVDFAKKHYFQKMLYIIFGLVLCLFLILMFIIKVNTNPVKFQDNLNKKISKILLKNSVGNKNNPEIIFNSPTELKIFPFPHLILKNITGKNLKEKNYQLNFEIEEIKLFVSLKSILLGKINITKFIVLNSDFEIKEFRENSNVSIIKSFLEEGAVDNSKEMVLINNNLKVHRISYERDFHDINLNGIISKNKLSFESKMLANKQSLNIDFSFSKNKKNDIKTLINLNSLAFNGNIKFDGNIEKKDLSGKIKFNIYNPQIFGRTLFNPSSFIYNRVIDNKSLDSEFSFSFKDDIFEVKDFKIDGLNIAANGSILYNFKENQKNNITLNIDKINLDNLITRNFISLKTFDENEISIFDKKEIKFIKNDVYRDFLIDKITMNPTIFNIKLKDIFLNDADIKDTELNLEYSRDGVKISKIVSFLPGDTKFSIEKNENENENKKIILEGKNFERFLSFLRDIKYEKEDDNKGNFKFSGDLFIKDDRLYIVNSDFNVFDFHSKNEIEVKFDNGVSFVAIQSYIDYLNLDSFNIEKKEKKEDLINTLKSKSLFLNNIGINTILGFNISKLKVGNFEDENYNFKIKMVPGRFDIKDINLNEKIIGNFFISIRTKDPILSLNLILNNLSYNKNINVSDILFKFPALNDFNGGIVIKGNNLLYKEQPIKTLNFVSDIDKGIVKIKDFNIDGFGGKCDVSGYLEYNFNKKLNLTLNGCTADIKNILGTIGINNISGLIGFSSVLYAEGQTKEIFNNRWILKTQLIGNGFTVNNYGLVKLNSDLFNIQNNVELLKNINPEEVLFNKEEKTMFEKISGSIQHTFKNKGQFIFDISRPLVNGKFMGTFDFEDGSIKINADNNLIMLVGEVNKTIPLTILSKVFGSLPSDLKINTDFKQVNEYIKLIRNNFENSIN